MPPVHSPRAWRVARGCAWCIAIDSCFIALSPNVAGHGWCLFFLGGVGFVEWTYTYSPYSDTLPIEPQDVPSISDFLGWLDGSRSSTTF